MPQLSSYMQYYSMVRYFTHHSSLKGVKIQSLNLLYGVYIVCVPNNIHHFDTHMTIKVINTIVNSMMLIFQG